MFFHCNKEQKIHPKAKHIPNKLLKAVEHHFETCVKHVD